MGGIDGSRDDRFLVVFISARVPCCSLTTHNLLTHDGNAPVHDPNASPEEGTTGSGPLRSRAVVACSLGRSDRQKPRWRHPTRHPSGSAWVRMHTAKTRCVPPRGGSVSLLAGAGSVRKNPRDAPPAARSAHRRCPLEKPETRIRFATFSIPLYDLNTLHVLNFCLPFVPFRELDLIQNLCCCCCIILNFIPSKLPLQH